MLRRQHTGVFSRLITDETEFDRRSKIDEAPAELRDAFVVETNGGSRAIFFDV